MEPEIRMQSRRLRMKNLGYLLLFTAWNVGVITFIMYRMKSDDLEDLEKEAYERIQFTNQGKGRRNLE